jgi:serpin B
MRWLLGVLGLTLAAGCGAQDRPADQAKVAESGMIPNSSIPERIRGEYGDAYTADQPDPYAVQTAALAETFNGFGFDIYHQLAMENEDSNLLFSPMGLATSLSLVALGSEGETRRAFNQVVHLPSRPLLLDAMASAPGAQGGLLRLSSSIWVENSMPLASGYRGMLNQIPGITLRQVNFAGNSAGAIADINAWANGASEGRIQQLIEPMQIDSSTRLVAADVVYFKAPWLFPFDPDATMPRTFHVNRSTPVTVPMMEMTDVFPHTHGRGATWVELPYAQDPTGQRQLVMVVVLPDGDLQPLENQWTWDEVEGALTKLQPAPVHLVMPKFEFSYREEWNNVLRHLGLGVAFSTLADFSGIDGAQDLMLGSVVEESWISVDETGTEAASASSASLSLKSIRIENPVEVVVDRPFLFMIYDRASRQVVFLGRMMNPNS